jgi:hypothetical protein
MKHCPLEKRRVPDLVKIFRFMEPTVSLPYSQEPAT